MQRPRQIVLLVLPWCHDFHLGALGHPGRPHLGQQVHIQLIGKDHHLVRRQVFVMKAHTGQPFDPVWVVIFRDQLGPFPYPADLVEPAADRFG